MVINYRKYSMGHEHVLRDNRLLIERIIDWIDERENVAIIYIMMIAVFFMIPQAVYFLDIIFLIGLGYFIWLSTLEIDVPSKLPLSAKGKYKCPNSPSGEPEGIMYLGNEDHGNQEIWYSNSEIRTHILYLGTTGAGKTEGLKSLVTNALCWSSGFVFIDGKADTDLWSTMSALVRRFGRDDDLFVLNYMTGNSDERAPSNTMNPFASGSASYLTNMLVSLMPEADGDNAMWKERAVSLISSLMPVMTYKRDKQDMPLSISVIRKNLELSPIIKLSRDESVPEHLRESVVGYLNTLPGYVDAVFDDDGNEKPAGPDTPMVDTQVVRQQHGYLSMQFTRSLQSLGDDYGYIFDSPYADIDMVDVVLNRRFVLTLIPALEKSSDETANLGKIVAATLKGMMGSTLGSSIEGSASTVIENKPTHFTTPFITVFDEVGYYTAPGMAVMAAQARSLGFSLVFAAQDLPALEKRVKEESRSVTGNCNIKIFGKLEDPTQTKEFFKNTVGAALVMESTGFSTEAGSLTQSYTDGRNVGLQVRDKADYSETLGFKPGEAVVCFKGKTIKATIYYSDPGHAQAMRVQRLQYLPAPDDSLLRQIDGLRKLRDRMVSKDWSAQKAGGKTELPPELVAAMSGFHQAETKNADMLDAGIAAVANALIVEKGIDIDAHETSATTAKTEQKSAPAAPKLKADDKKSENVAAKTQSPAAEAKKDGSPDWNALLGDDDKSDAPEEAASIKTAEPKEEPKAAATVTAKSQEQSTKPAATKPVETETVDARVKEELPSPPSEDIAEILRKAADNITNTLLANTANPEGQANE